MNYKLLGAIMVMTACGGFGLKLVAAYRYEERTLRQMIAILDFMSCELQYRLSPLPSLCRQASEETKGSLSDLFLHLAEELENQISPDANYCMLTAIAKTKGLPRSAIACLEALGKSLGKFDLTGQIRGIEGVRQSCRSTLENMDHDKTSRLRSYQTLALCAGAAIAILLV